MSLTLREFLPGDQRVGFCALLPMAPSVSEVATKAIRSAVTPAVHVSLTPALRLCTALGVKHLPSTRGVPSVYERANVFTELPL